jgi:hypothetical protein
VVSIKFALAHSRPAIPTKSQMKAEAVTQERLSEAGCFITALCSVIENSLPM